MSKNMAEDGVEEKREIKKQKELGGLRTMPFILGELASSSSVLSFLHSVSCCSSSKQMNLSAFFFFRKIKTFYND